MVMGEFNTKLKTCTDTLCLRCGTRLCLYCMERVPKDTAPEPLALAISARLHKPKPMGHVCANEAAARLARFAQNPRNCVKPCPQCFMLLYRYEGCTHMTCSGPLGCRAEFCWLCLTPKVLYHDCLLPAEPSPMTRMQQNIANAVTGACVFFFSCAGCPTDRSFVMSQSQRRVSRVAPNGVGGRCSVPCEHGQD